MIAVLPTGALRVHIQNRIYLQLSFTIGLYCAIIIYGLSAGGQLQLAVVQFKSVFYLLKINHHAYKMAAG